MIIETEVTSLHALTKETLLAWFDAESPTGRRLQAMQSLADALACLAVAMRCLGLEPLQLDQTEE